MARQDAPHHLYLQIEAMKKTDPDEYRRLKKQYGDRYEKSKKAYEKLMAGAKKHGAD